MKQRGYISDGEIFLVAGAAMVALLIFIVVAMIQEDKEWQAFKKAHNCQVVAKVRGEIFNTYGVSSSGNMTIGVGSTSDKTGWKCDDGVTYYR